MGNNNNIHFQDYKEAAEVLMERNMPDVLHNRQREAVFMPETHLPNNPRNVEDGEYERIKVHLDKADLSFLGMSSEKEDIRNAPGDLVEKELFLELKKFYKDQKVVVFWGLKLKLPGK